MSNIVLWMGYPHLDRDNCSCYSRMKGLLKFEASISYSISLGMLCILRIMYTIISDY